MGTKNHVNFCMFEYYFCLEDDGVVFPLFFIFSLNSFFFSKLLLWTLVKIYALWELKQIWLKQITYNCNYYMEIFIFFLKNVQLHGCGWNPWYTHYFPCCIYSIHYLFLRRFFFLWNFQHEVFKSTVMGGRKCIHNQNNDYWCINWNAKSCLEFVHQPMLDGGGDNSIIPPPPTY